jgi:hypothetical protein
MHPRVRQLLEIETAEQRSAAWLQARENCLTASEISAALYLDEDACEHYVRRFGLEDFAYHPKKGCHPYLSLKKLVEKKAHPALHKFESNPYVEWGQKYEKVICTMYQQLRECTVHDFGLLIHPEYNWLGASPDGITSDGLLLEV